MTKGLKLLSCYVVRTYPALLLRRQSESTGRIYDLLVDLLSLPSLHIDVPEFVKGPSKSGVHIEVGKIGRFSRFEFNVFRLKKDTFHLRNSLSQVALESGMQRLSEVKESNLAELLG